MGVRCMNRASQPTCLRSNKTEHERRAEDDLLDAGLTDDLFLALLGLGVVVDGRRGDSGGGDVDGVGDVIANGGLNDALSRRYVVAGVISGVDSTDLRVTVHQVGATDELVLPGAGYGEICMDDAQVRVQTAKSLGVRRMFVDRDNFTEALLLKPRNEVLPDEARSPCDHNLSGCHGSPQKPSVKQNYTFRRRWDLRKRHQGVSTILPIPPFSAAAWAAAASLRGMMRSMGIVSLLSRMASP